MKSYLVPIITFILALGIILEPIYAAQQEQADAGELSKLKNQELGDMLEACSEDSPIQKLIDEGANVNARDQVGYTPLHVAVYFNNLIAVACLLKNKAKVNKRRSDNGWTSLHTAAFWERKRVVPLLLEYHADINAQDHEGRTPSYGAAVNGNPAVLELLINAKADLFIKDNEGRSAIDIADGSEEADSFNDEIGELLQNRIILHRTFSQPWKTSSSEVPAYEIYTFAAIALRQKGLVFSILNNIFGNFHHPVTNPNSGSEFLQRVSDKKSEIARTVLKKMQPQGRALPTVSTEQ